MPKKSQKTSPRRTKARVGSVAGSAFIRERRYLVVKIKDANKYLTPAERDTLERIAAKCALGRIDDGKRALECVCVESDWPEYSPTWAAIEARVTAKPESTVTLRDLRKHYI